MRKSVVYTLSGVMAFAAIMVFLLWEDLILTRLITFFQAEAWWGLPWTMAVIGGVLVYMVFSVRSESKYRSSLRRIASDEETKDYVPPLWLGVLMIFATVGMIVWAVFSGAMHGYQVDQYYLKSAVTVKDPAPEFNERAAFKVARAQVRATAGEIRGTFVDDTTYMPETDKYTTLVVRPGPQGYMALSEETVALTGQASSRLCQFGPDANLKIGGWFSHNIWRAIAHQKSNVFFSEKDSYGFCDGDTPMVVIPLQKWQGWFPAVAVPAGVAVYNGTTGDVTVYDKAPEDLTGPVFPISLAEKMREATAAMGGYWDYVNERVGYTSTIGDAEDPNAGNNSEFALGYADSGQPVYVTPLTSRLQSESIIALGVVDASTVEAGVLPTYTIYELPKPRVSNSGVEDTLRVDYSTEIGWAAGMSIFEITPVTSEEWVASIGREKNVAFRVRIEADGSSCLETAQGVRVRCSSDAPTQGTETGGGDVNVNVPGTSEELMNLSDEELSALLEQLTGEVTRRLANS